MFFNADSDDFALGLGLTRERERELDEMMFHAFENLGKELSIKNLILTIHERIHGEAEAFYVGSLMANTISQCYAVREEA